MATWPTTNPATTTTDADSDSISGARSDINQAIQNVNAVVDSFNIGTPGAADDDKILVYDHASGKFQLETNSASGGNPLTSDLQVADFEITNTNGSNRGDAFVIGSGDTSVETSTSSIVSGIDTDLDIYSNSGQRIAGPVHAVVIDDLNTWNDRVHSNCFATKIELTDNFGESGSGAERGKARIRNGYYDATINAKGYQFGDFAFERFGDGVNAITGSVKAFTDVDNDTAHVHTVRSAMLVPQAEGSAAHLTGGNTFTVNKLIGAEVNPFVDTASEVGALIGYRLNTADVSGTVTNKYSFYSDDSDYTLKNLGPLEASGLSYPTSDGTSGQVLQTNGAGTLSFTTINTSSDLDITATGGLTTIKPTTANHGLVLDKTGTGRVSVANGSGNEFIVGASTLGTGGVVVSSQNNPTTGNIYRDGTGGFGIGSNSHQTEINSDGAINIKNQNVSSTPTNTSTPAAWLDIDINGTQYFIPLHQ
jgi:hypothetical protein